MLVAVFSPRPLASPPLPAVKPNGARADEDDAPAAPPPPPPPPTSAVSAYEQLTRTGASTQAPAETDVGAIVGSFLGPVVVGVGGFAAFSAFAVR